LVVVAAYLRGAIGHAIKRARDLIEIAQAGGQLEFRALQSKCTDELNEAIISLAQALQSLEATPEKINIIARIYQAKVQQISNVERVGVFALKNASNDDVELNKVLTAICREIRYPLLTPTVSHTSQDYFEISPLFSLLRVPLLEGRYFLHLSDLYHELCHPLLALHGSTNPRLDALSEAFRLIKNERGVTLDRAAVRVERRRGSPDMAYRYAIWRRCWVETWCEEFLCDAFGAFCAGPAFGWTNLHLCVNRTSFQSNGKLFHTPMDRPSSHPADDARMSVILHVLEEIGCQPEAQAISRAWQEFIASSNSQRNAHFDICYPAEALSSLAKKAVAAFRACGMIGLDIEKPQPISGMLQSAWEIFWSPTQSYDAWEKDARAELLRTIP
jgi:hypothetical protein